MSPSKPPSGTIPTLTEVVAWPAAAPAPVESAAETSDELPAPDVEAGAAGTATAAPSAPVPPVAPAAPISSPAVAAPPQPPREPARSHGSELQATQRVLADLQRQVELMLEVRLREALTPIISRAADALVRDARKELTTAMREIVSRSIAREIGRREER